MEDFELNLSSVLGIIENEGAVGFDDEKIEELEALLYECVNRQKSDEYVNQIADSIWDALYDMLRQVKPDSGLLANIWDDDGDITDYTELLQSHPMMSIETAKSYECDQIIKYVDRMPGSDHSYFASYKINGHGIRVVYKDGYLVSATSRARSSAGRDLTRHAKVMCPEYNESLAEYGLVELRGEACLKLENLEKAREYNPTIKSAFSAVASLIRPSATDEEIELLDFLCYGFIVDGFSFETREEEFAHIEAMGFLTPQYMLIESANKSNLLDVMKGTVEAMEESYEDFGYYCDGVVFEINDRNLFESFGVEGSHKCGNIALKVGVWKQDQYPGYVQTILWKKGKSKMSPVAIIADKPRIAMFVDDDEGVGKTAIFDDKEIQNMSELGVLTAQGNSVKHVPLYEPKNILILNAYVGHVIYFRYGGEAGVVPCFPDGRLLKEDAALDIFKGESAPWDYQESEEEVVVDE